LPKEACRRVTIDRFHRAGNGCHTLVVSEQSYSATAAPGDRCSLYYITHR
jgi:hypothetical protein